MYREGTRVEEPTGRRRDGPRCQDFGRPDPYRRAMIGTGGSDETVPEAIGNDDIARDRSQPWPAIAIGVVLSVLIRLRSFWTPITSDEGGFLAIARAWAHGKVLYRDVWVDRPQGLLVIFRVWDWVSGGSVASARIMAMIFGAALVIGVGIAATSMAGRSAGAVAAILVAISAASPAIEGHLANGELLSAPFAVAGMAAACAGLRRADRQWLMILSGVMAGCAISVKQSGFEGLLAIGLWLVVAVLARWRTPRVALLALVRLIGGLLIVLAVLAVHGALTGFSRWWYAFAGYRLDQRSALKGADWARFFTTARVARPTIWPLLAVATVGCVALGISWIQRSRRSRSGGPHTSSPSGPAGHRVEGVGRGSAALVFVWSVSATVAFLTGGQFHRHYWITLCPALSVLAAVLVTRRIRTRFAFAIVLVLLIPTYVNTIKILVLGNREFPAVASGDDRLASTDDLARWFLEHRSPGDTMYVMCASASFYADADQDPLMPYLWADNVEMVPHALDALRSLIGSPTRAPRFIAIYQLPRTCDISGRTGALVDARYQKLTRISGVEVLERIPP